MESQEERHKRLEETLKKLKKDFIQCKIDLENEKKQRLEAEKRIKNFGFGINEEENYDQRINELISKKSTMDPDEFLEKIKSLKDEILTSLEYDLGYQIAPFGNNLIKSAYQIINQKFN